MTNLVMHPTDKYAKIFQLLMRI